MGSIAVINSSSDFKICPSYSLRKVLGDKCNPKLSRADKDELKIRKGGFQLSKTGYNQATYGYYKDKFIFIFSEPCPFFYALGDYRIIWHQSQWKNQEEVVLAFVDIFGFEDASSIFFKGKLIRLDVWLDTELTYEEAKASIYRPKVSVKEEYRSGSRTTYLGAKGNKRAVIYEKPKEKVRGRSDVRRKKR